MISSGFNPRDLVFPVLVAMLPLVLFAYYFAPAGMSRAYMTGLLFWVFVFLLLFNMKRERQDSLDGQFLRHSNLFLIGFLIVHFQHYIDFLAGRISEGSFGIWANPEVVSRAMALSTIGLLCFFVGYLLAQRSRQKVFQRSGEIRYRVTILLRGLALGALSIYFLTVDPRYVMGGYGIVDMGRNATYASYVFDISIFAIIIQECRNVLSRGVASLSISQYVKATGYTTIAMIAPYLMVVLLSGDRGGMIYYSLCYVSGYLVITRKKVGLLKGLVAIFLAATLISVLGVARTMTDAGSFQKKIQMAVKMQGAAEGESVIPQTQELAGSVKTVHHVLDSVPERHEYLYGRFQFQQMITAVPFASYIYPVIFDDSSTKYGSVAVFITWIIQGDSPTYGNGSSVIADFYIAFGVFGVVVGMMVFGWFIRRAEYQMYASRHPVLLWHIASVVYFCNAVYISRSSALESFKFIVWIYAVLLFNSLLVGRISRG